MIDRTKTDIYIKKFLFIFLFFIFYSNYQLLFSIDKSMISFNNDTKSRSYSPLRKGYYQLQLNNEYTTKIFFNDKKSEFNERFYIEFPNKDEFSMIANLHYKTNTSITKINMFRYFKKDIFSITKLKKINLPNDEFGTRIRLDTKEIFIVDKSGVSANIGDSGISPTLLKKVSLSEKIKKWVKKHSKYGFVSDSRRENYYDVVFNKNLLVRDISFYDDNTIILCLKMFNKSDNPYSLGGLKHPHGGILFALLEIKQIRNNYLLDFVKNKRWNLAKARYYNDLALKYYHEKSYQKSVYYFRKSIKNYPKTESDIIKAFTLKTFSDFNVFPVIETKSSFVLALIKNKQYDEAEKIANEILNLKGDFGKTKSNTIHNLKLIKRLKSKKK